MTGSRATSALRGVVIATALAGTVSCKGCGCGKKESDAPVTAPPPLGAASQTELTTPLGPARGLDESLASTSTKWRRVFVLDDKRVVLTGETTTETVALMTDDAGKSWRSLHIGREGWANWNVGLDGALVLAAGQRAGAKGANEGALDATKFAFAVSDSTTLGPFTPLFPPAKGALKGRLLSDTAIPAFVSPEYAVLVADDGKKATTLQYGGRPGVEPVPALKGPPGEKLVTVPYGRPPSLLSIKGKDLFVRPMPAAGKPLEKPQKVQKLVAPPTLLAELSAAPACDFGEWSFQRVKLGDGLAVIGVGGHKTVVIPLPATTSPTTSLGCNGARVIVEATDAKGKEVLVSCDFDGTCTEPQNSPFRPWPERHEQRIASAPSDKGIVAVLHQHSGDRWGVYVAQSNDSVIFEQPRVVGEGAGDRGRVEVGAFIGLGTRTILLLSSDLTGTSRRGWYVTATDDGGTNWNAP